jgi:two-component system response regulator AtoC
VDNYPEINGLVAGTAIGDRAEPPRSLVGLSSAFQLPRAIAHNMPRPKTKKSSPVEMTTIPPSDHVLFGRSAAMMEVRQRALKVCDTDVPVLLTGHGGTGKEVLARWMHGHSPNRGGQFVKVNCAAIPSALIESELFGFEKGAFTGATIAKPGRVELAQGGTLFLDEIADLDLGLQSKLLHFLQDGRFARIGGTEQLVETRLICATNRDLEEEINIGRFRSDLYYRINVIRIKLPRLRERPEDIPILAEYFVDYFQRKFSKRAEPLDRGNLAYLQNSDWPGNIRELSNEMARYVLFGAEVGLAPSPITNRNPLTRSVAAAEKPLPLKQIGKAAVREGERVFILDALRAHHWNRRKTAKSLRISYRTLIYKIRDAGLIPGQSHVAPGSSS